MSPYSWTDPEQVAANAAGRVTRAQRVMIAGRWLRPPKRALIPTAIGVPLAVCFGVSAPHVWWFPVTVMLVDTLLFALILGGWQWGARWDRWQLRRRAARARVASALGRVEDHDSGRVACVGPIRIAVSGIAPLMPGPYRLFWLELGRVPPGRVLLSAQPEDVDEPPAAGAAIVEAAATGPLLLSAFGLQPQDLVDNRAGRVTAAQRAGLPWRSRRVLAGKLPFPIDAMLVGAVATGLVAAGAAFGYIAQLVWGRVTVGSVVGGLFVAGIFIFTFVTAAAGFAWERSCKLFDARVQARTPARSATGPVRVHRVSRPGRADTWWVSQEALLFEVTPQVARAFAVPLPYTLHYLPEPATLLSAEPAQVDPAPS